MTDQSAEKHVFGKNRHKVHPSQDTVMNLIQDSQEKEDDDPSVIIFSHNNQKRDRKESTLTENMAEDSLSEGALKFKDPPKVSTVSFDNA